MDSGWRAYAYAGVILPVLALGACRQGATSAPPGDAPAGEVANTVTPVTSPAPPIAAIPVAGPERLVLAFGDSLYAGYKLQPGESLPATVETLLRRRGIDARVVNAGVSGDTTADGRARLGFALDKLPRKPDLVLLGLGGNDVLRQLPVAETRANLTAILDELRRRKIPVVLTGMLAPPNLGPDYAGRFNALYPEFAKTYAADLDPFILAGVLGNRRLMLSDGVHPNAAGVRLIAARIAPLVDKRLREVEG